MTTDDIKEVTEQTPSEEPTNTNSEPSTTGNISDKMLDDLFSKFNNKVDELIQSHKSEVEQLKDEITKKNDEIKKLEQINHNLVLSTDVSKGNKEITDYSKVNFDEVDWSSEAQTYMGKLDAKLFGTN